MAGDLNAKRGLELEAERETGKLLRDYAEENSCLIFGPDSTTTNPCNPSVTPNVLDIVITKNLSFPLYLISCSALILGALPVLIDTTCRSSFHHPPDALTSVAMTGPTSRLIWKN